jgi:Holliday junction DNA helicase RuvA
LVRLPGVGQKTAERLIIEMRGRLPEIGDISVSKDKSDSVVNTHVSPRQEAITALCALGYKPQDAAKMVQAIATEDKSCEDIIRMALRGAIK